MSSLIRTPHQNTAGSFFIITGLDDGEIITGIGAGQTNILRGHNNEGVTPYHGLLWKYVAGNGTAANPFRIGVGTIGIKVGDVLIDLGETELMTIGGETYTLKKVALTQDPTATGYIHIPTFGTNTPNPGVSQGTNDTTLVRTITRFGPQEHMGPRVAKFQL
jgi:hypothetical protein